MSREISGEPILCWFVLGLHRSAIILQAATGSIRLSDKSGFKITF